MSATTVPSPEQQQRAEQVRQLKRYEPWRLAFAGATAGAALFAAGAGVMALLLRMHS